MIKVSNFQALIDANYKQVSDYNVEALAMKNQRKNESKMRKLSKRLASQRGTATGKGKSILEA